MLGASQAIAPIEGRREGKGRGKIASTLLRSSKCFSVYEPEPGSHISKSIDICHRTLWDCGFCFPDVRSEQYLLAFQWRGAGFSPLLLVGQPSLSFDRPGLCSHSGGNFSALTLKIEERLLGQQTLSLSPLFISNLNQCTRWNDTPPLPLRTPNW